MGKSTAGTSTGLPPVAKLLRGATVARLGRSRVGRLFETLLVQQGAAATVDAAKADVVIDDRTGAAGNAPLPGTAANAIVVRFTDFPKSHPLASAPRTLNDELIHAELGLNRLSAGKADGDPSGPYGTEPLAMASAYGAIWAAVAAGAALLRRDQTGRGDTIEWPLYSAGLTVLARRLLFPESPAVIDPLALPHLPQAEIYLAADGRYVMSQGHHAGFVEAMMTAAGKHEWSDEAGKGLARLPDRAAEAMWGERMAGMFRERPAMEWENRIVALNGALTVCRTVDEWVANEHAREADIIIEEGGRPTVGPGVRTFVPEDLPRATVPARPIGAQPGAQTGAKKDQIKPGDLPLAGVKVVDFAIILAGPTCGRTLAELGAEVTKIDPAVRPGSTYGWLDVNRGKRCLAVNLRRAAGLDIARRLVAGCDVLVENFRVGKLASLGLSFEEAARLRPGIVYASLNAFDHGGPWSARAGWEHNAQAASGMQVARAQDGVAKQVPVPVNDYSTGLLGAFGVLMALREARATGRAVRVGGSLARSATFIRDDQLFPHLSANDVRTATQVIRCADGWVRAEKTAAFDKLPSAFVPGLAGVSSLEAITKFAAAGVVAVRERILGELAKDRTIDADHLRVNWKHPYYGAMDQIIVHPSQSGVGCALGWPAEDPGEETRSILGELGYGAKEIDIFIKTRVVAERVPLFDQ